MGSGKERSMAQHLDVCFLSLGIMEGAGARRCGMMGDTHTGQRDRKGGF